MNADKRTGRIHYTRNSGGSIGIITREERSVDIGRNLVGRVDMSVGDLENGWEEADVIVENTYYAHYAQHCPTEPHISLAYPDADGRIVIIISTLIRINA